MTALLLASGAEAATFVIPDQAKLTADDGAQFDLFGSSVAIDGTTALVGSPLDDDTGSNSGSAYLYDIVTETPITKLAPGDASALDRFGISVGLSGNLAIVGSYIDDDDGSDSGSAYVFNATTGAQVSKLTAADAAANDRFGISVDISGNTAIVGSQLDDDAGSRSGSAYLFNATTGAQLFKLTADDAGSGDRFGTSVAIDGTTAIVGSIRDDDKGSDAGAAYVFDVTTGNQLFKLTAGDGDTSDNFGTSVAISGNFAIVGSPFEDTQGVDAGAAYLFDLTTGQQVGKLTPRAGDGGNFGASVAISGDKAIVGSPFEDDVAIEDGSVYVFDVPTARKIGKLRASDAENRAHFGSSVGLSGSNAVIGAPNNNALGDDSGAAYLTAAPVPLPAGAWLLGTALGILILRRKRHHA